MVNNTVKMSFDEDFEKIYKNDCKLPKKISDAYSVFSCLKYYDERQVYIVKDTQGKKYVLKIGTDDNSLRIENEYRIASMIGESGINDGFPRPVMFFHEDGHTYYIREYIAGVTLRDQIDKKCVLPEQQVCLIAGNICSILERIHNLPNRIICRDIKPENIVISSDGQCHIIDLDAARIVKPENDTDTVCLGTRTTAAPEQFGFGQTDERTDVYALGMLMLYMISGGYDKNALRRGKAARIIRRATSFDPERRYMNVSKMRSALVRNRRAPQLIAAALICTALVVLTVIIPYSIGTQASGTPDSTAENNYQSKTSNIPEAASESISASVSADSPEYDASSLGQVNDQSLVTASPTASSDNMTSFSVVTEAVGDKEISDMYRAINTGWVLNEDGSYSYTCVQDDESIDFRLLPEEHFDLKKLRYAAVTVNTTGCEAWFCLIAPDIYGNWFHSTPMGIKDIPEKVSFDIPDGISGGLTLSINGMMKGEEVTVRDISYSDREYTGPDMWHKNDDGSFTFTKDTVTSLAFFPESDIELSKVNYVYADIEVKGEMVCGIAGFNDEDGFTYCDGYTIKDESRHLCWDLKHGLYNGKISKELSFDCYFYSDDLTATVKNIVFSEEPVFD